MKRSNMTLATAALAVAMTGCLGMSGNSGELLVYHIDMNAHQMNRAAIERHLAHVASQGYNAILWEIENKVKFACAPKLASKDAFSREEFQEILAYADRLGLEAIPLMQTFGHAEYVLGLPEYADMREDPKFDDCYCVLNPKTLAFQRALLDEYLAIFGSRLKRFHLGGDEAEHFHTCAQCKRHDKAALYIGHLEKIAEGLRAKGIRPGVWHDMLQRFDKKGSKFSLLPKDFVLWYWEYFFTGPETALKPNLSWASGAEEAVVAERRGGREVILCSASQCYVDGPFMTRTERHRANVAGLADVARREGMGYCVTSWMCHQGPKDLQYPLYDLGAKRFLDPGAGVEQDWREIVRRYCGNVEVKTLDDLTVWGATSIGTDGREKNEVVPERGKFLRAFRDKPAEAKKKSDWALLEKRYVDGALAKLRTVPDDEMTPYLRRLIEAGELTSEHLGMVAEGVLGRAIRSPQVERVKRFYAQELTPHSVEVVTGKLFNGYVE